MSDCSANMAQSVFAQVKAAVSAPDIWRRYGGAEMRGGYVNCVFHPDRNPSLRLYEGDKGYYCFACGAGGDAVKLASALLGLGPYEAAKRVAADFGLTMNSRGRTPGRPGCAALKTVNCRLRRERSFEAWRRDAESALCDYHRLLWQAKHNNAPRTRDDALHPLFAEACRNLDYAAYALEWLADDPMGFYKANRDYIEKVVQRLGII